MEILRITHTSPPLKENAKIFRPLLGSHTASALSRLCDIFCRVIPANFCSKENNRYKCICNKKEDIEHVYNCTILNKCEPKLEYEKIYSENIKEQKLIMKRFEINLKKRNEIKNNNEPCDPLDPLYSNVVENSNG